MKRVVLMADALGVDDENFTKFLPVACGLGKQIAFYINTYANYKKLKEGGET